MNAHVIIFYFLAAFILGTGLMAVTARKIFRAAIWLLSSLVGIAGLYFWMQVEFIAAVQIVVYVGGIVVLIIFFHLPYPAVGNGIAQTLRPENFVCSTGRHFRIWILRPPFEPASFSRSFFITLHRAG